METPIPPDPNIAPTHPIPPQPNAAPPAGTPPPASTSFSLQSVLDQSASPVIPSTKDERMWAMIMHLTNLVCCVGVVITLILWTQKKAASAFVNDQGKEALNFWISVFIAGIAIGTISTILSAVKLGVVGNLLSGMLMVYFLAMSIIAALKANDGIAFRHPYTLRLIK